MSIFPCIAARKLTNAPAVIFSYSCWSRWFLFRKQIIVLIWVVIYSYLQRFFKTGVPKMLYKFQRKKTVSESFFNQLVACYFLNKRLRLRRFLVGITKLSRTPFYKNTLILLILYLLNIFVTITTQNVMLNNQSGFSNHLLRLINMKMSYEVILFLLPWFCKICCLVWLPLSWRRFLSYINQSTDLYKIPYLNTNFSWKT